MLHLRLVGGARHGGAEFDVLLAEPARRERIHDGVADAVEIEMLAADEIEIAPRQSATGRPGVAARRLRRRLGKRIALRIGVALPDPIGLQVLPPARGQMRAQLLERELGMEIAVDDLDLGFLRPKGRLELHVHGRLSSDSIYADGAGSDRPSQ